MNNNKQQNKSGEANMTMVTMATLPIKIKRILKQQPEPEQSILSMSLPSSISISEPESDSITQKKAKKNLLIRKRPSKLNLSSIVNRNENTTENVVFEILRQPKMNVLPIIPETGKFKTIFSCVIVKGYLFESYLITNRFYKVAIEIMSKHSSTSKPQSPLSSPSSSLSPSASPTSLTEWSKKLRNIVTKSIIVEEDLIFRHVVLDMGLKEMSHETLDVNTIDTICGKETKMASRGMQSVRGWFIGEKQKPKLLLILSVKNICSFQVWYAPTTGALAFLVTSAEAILKRARFLPETDKMLILSSIIPSNINRICKLLFKKFLQVLANSINKAEQGTEGENEIKNQNQCLTTPKNKRKFADTENQLSPCFECDACLTSRKRKTKKTCTKILLNNPLQTRKKLMNKKHEANQHEHIN